MADEPAAASGAYFDALYAEQPDPWGLDERFYERRKRDLVLASLPRAHVSPGVRTRLRDRPAHGRAGAALRRGHRLGRRAGRRRAGVARGSATGPRSERVIVEQRRIPADWPAGRFDLIVVSEVGYYCPDLGQLQLPDRGRAWPPDGVLLACHWRHPADDHPVTAADVHTAIGTGLTRIVAHRRGRLPPRCAGPATAARSRRAEGIVGVIRRVAVIVPGRRRAGPYRRLPARDRAGPPAAARQRPRHRPGRRVRRLDACTDRTPATWSRRFAAHARPHDRHPGARCVGAARAAGRRQAITLLPQPPARAQLWLANTDADSKYRRTGSLDGVARRSRSPGRPRHRAAGRRPAGRASDELARGRTTSTTGTRTCMAPTSAFGPTPISLSAAGPRRATTRMSSWPSGAVAAGVGIVRTGRFRL